MQRRVKLLQRSLARDLQSTNNTLVNNVFEFKKLSQDIVDAINTGDENKALELTRSFQELMKSHTVALERFKALQKEYDWPDYRWIDWRDIECDDMSPVLS